MWEAGSRTGVISNIALPAPSEAFRAFMDLVHTGMLWKHLNASLYRLLIGWTLGSLLGVAVGLAIGLFSLARAGFLPLVSALFPIPKIALLPLFIIWFGIGEGSKVATILFRISASIAIVLLVAAEMIGAEYGIGAYILMAGALFATDQLIAGVAILSVMGLTMSWLIGRAERYFLYWRT